MNARARNLRLAVKANRIKTGKRKPCGSVVNVTAASQASRQDRIHAWMFWQDVSGTGLCTGAI